jgi:hypothetical protein
MNSTSDEQIIDQLEARGLQKLTLIKRGMIEINGVESYYAYYHDPESYFHTITQIRNGQIHNLTHTCDWVKKNIYMAYIFRVVNSLK